MVLNQLNDRGNKALLLIFIIGIGSTLPFNILMNATVFFSKKLDKEKANDDLKNAIAMFSSFIVTFMGMASTLPNIFLQLYNAVSTSSSGGVKRKLLGSIVVQIGCLGCIIGACFIDAVEHPYLFFYTLILLAFLLNAAGGLYQNLSFVLAANLPMKYTNANVTGSNLGGVISALATIISIAVSKIFLSVNEQFTSVIFFLMAIAFTAAQLFTISSLYKNNYYKSNLPENENDDQSGLNEKSTEKLTARPVRDGRFLLTVFKECWPQLLNIFLTFYVSLIVFPAVQVGIQSVNENPSGYFIPLYTFMNFNLFAMIGNAVTFWDKFPITKKEKVWIYVVLRFAFIPFFLFCNYMPETRNLPVIIRSDTIYVLGGALLGFTSGYFSSLGLMYAPKSVSRPEYCEYAAKMAAFSLITGIFLGISSSFFMPYIVKF